MKKKLSAWVEDFQFIFKDSESWMEEQSQIKYRTCSSIGKIRITYF